MSIDLTMEESTEIEEADDADYDPRQDIDDLDESCLILNM